IVEQVRAAPAAWLIAGGIAALFAAVPGMPWPVFLFLAAMMLAFGAMRLRSKAAQAEAEAAARRRAAIEQNVSVAAGPDMPIPDERDVRQIVPMRQIVISVSRSMSVDARFSELVRAARRARNEIVMRYGVTVPNLDTEGTERLEGDEYEIAIHEVVVARGQLRWDCLCVPVGALSGALRSHAHPQTYPLIDGASWIELDRLAADASLAADGVGAANYFSRLLSELLHRHAAQFVGIHEAQLLFSWVQREMPAAAKELSQAVSLPRFAQVLRMLVSERVSLRNVKQIVEALVFWAPLEKETAALAEHVRLALRAQLCQEFANDGVLYVLLLDRDLEERLRASLQQTVRGARLALEHETVKVLLAQARRLALAAGHRAARPVMLSAQELRRPLRQLVLDDWFDLHVLSYAELTPAQRVHSLGTLAFADHSSKKASSTSMGSTGQVPCV
ncbi:MAG: type secretion protein, partial [Paraburkholderia sp.]|nr:type secretion protein [Paraburkholderia sp.]